MNLRTGVPLLAVLYVNMVGAARVQGSEYSTIDCVHATTTAALSINTPGQTVGYCLIGGYPQAFVRQPDGLLSTFAADAYGTEAVDINDNGETVGWYTDVNNLSHAFTLSSAGLTKFDVPGADQTIPVGINASGVIGGWSLTNGVVQGFTRDALGNIRTFKDLNFIASEVLGLNDLGDTVGYAQDSAGIHGFVQDAQGNVTLFDAPGSDPTQGTYATAINSNGLIVGRSVNSRTRSQGFIRSASGTFTTFSAHGAGSNGYAGTFPESINDSGEIAGYGLTSGFINFAFTSSDGSAPVTFQDPSAVTSMAREGTISVRISSNNRVVGYYVDAAGSTHGFLRNALPPDR
jgi:hypothetical protein